MVNDQPGELEKKTYKIFGYGDKGDAKVKLEDGSTCYVKINPGLKVGIGTGIHITNLRSGQRGISFAIYYQPGHTVPQVAATQPSTVQVQPGIKTSTPLESQVSASYKLFIGPVALADKCAMAIVPKDVLGMDAYKGLVWLIEHHEDNTVFPQEVDRDIAGRLHSAYQHVKGKNSMESLVLTLENEVVKPDSTKPLSSYFKKADAIGSKYRAMAVIPEEKSTAAQKPEEDVKKIEEPKKKPVSYTAVGTAKRIGSPG